MPWSLRRNVPFGLRRLVRHVRLLILITLLRRHLARKVARRYAVNSHARLLELGRHKLRQVHGGAFCGVV